MNDRVEGILIGLLSALIVAVVTHILSIERMKREWKRSDNKKDQEHKASLERQAAQSELDHKNAVALLEHNHKLECERQKNEWERQLTDFQAARKLKPVQQELIDWCKADPSQSFFVLYHGGGIVLCGEESRKEKHCIYTKVSEHTFDTLLEKGYIELLNRNDKGQIVSFTLAD